MATTTPGFNQTASRHVSSKNGQIIRVGEYLKNIRDDMLADTQSGAVESHVLLADASSVVDVSAAVDGTAITSGATVGMTPSSAVATQGSDTGFSWSWVGWTFLAGWGLAIDKVSRSDSGDRNERVLPVAQIGRAHV